MADNTPDISRIVKLIMDNPALIEQIGAMMKSDGDAKKKPETEENEIEATRDAVATPALPSQEDRKAKNRRDLLYALKPYLSEKRNSAIDSMLSVAEVFSMLKR